MATSPAQNTAPTANPFSGLQAGRIVNYVLKSGGIRPLLVTVAWLTTRPRPEDPNPGPTGVINGVIFRDGTNDDGEFQVPLPEPTAEDPTASRAIPNSVRLAEWATSVKYDPAGSPGTWHWPPVKAVAQSTPLGIMMRFDDLEEVIMAMLAKMKKHGIEPDLPAHLIDDFSPDDSPSSIATGISGATGASGSEATATGQEKPRTSDVITQSPLASGLGHAPALHPDAPEKPATATEGNKTETA